MSGFNTIEECFGKFTDRIFAIETGLSSDPSMNWRLSKLDHIAFISNSDSHSLERIGREANIFNTELSYRGILDALRARNPNMFTGTIEFFPEEGKYHYDGHRACNTSLHPDESQKRLGICPVCGKRMTIGVMNRISSLANRPPLKMKRVPMGAMEGHVAPGRIPYVSLVPLDEIISEALNVGPGSKSVLAEYEKLIRAFGSEISVLMERSLKDISDVAKVEVVFALDRVRRGELAISPGYDGEYGTIRIFKDDSERENIALQKSLF